MENKKLTINEDTSSKEHLCYTTDMGTFFYGFCEDVLKNKSSRKFKGKVQLIFTSPPFPLNRKKNMEIFRVLNMYLGYQTLHLYLKNFYHQMVLLLWN